MNKFHIDYHYIDSPIAYGETLFVQLGRLWFSPSGVVAKHAHGDLYELTVVTDGKGTVYTNDVPTEVSKGDIYLSYPGDFHKICSSDNEPMKYDFFAFNTQNEGLQEELRSIVAAYGYNERVFRDSRVQYAVSDAIAEYTSKQEYHNEIMSLLFSQIIYYTVRSFRTDKPLMQSKYTVSADELCYQIMHYIDTNIYSIEKLSVLAKVFNYNYSYLSDIFKRTTGNTIAEYYQTRRLDTAALLLKEKKLKIGRIAEMLRYSSLYSFSKAFKNKFGISPKGYN